MKRLLLATVILAAMFSFVAVAAGNDDKVTICHAAGQAGTTQYVTITVDRSALKGHFNENGTPAAGHEQDYFGACKAANTGSPTASPSASPTSTGRPTNSPSAKPSNSPTGSPTPLTPKQLPTTSTK